MKKILTLSSICFVGLVLVMMAAFSIHKYMIGGDAFSGRVKDGKYYIWVEDEIYKEVPKQTWLINKILFTAMLVTGGLAIGGIAYLGITYYLPFILKQVK
ncbi:hypothetical protein QA601_18875 [Chitinispirillales bacterium ANBcel5]|uniref:hypothetical protein n=1 Tax=Cellulosispirillum alkaliphilum TaxID=3039283 RepID=UPI002A588B78|nr:hypothetical protein [Chitinispirillales bacterium ANBcel5]